MSATKFTEEQAEILQFAQNGHNILITGQAGTGKSTIVNAIRDDCKKRGLKVDLICSSGIACKVYERGAASTVHSHYALGAADMPSELLISRAISDARVQEKIRNADIVIWDEASMSSSRMLELVNALHHGLSEDQDTWPFAGKQIIIVGEFLQLRPVPSAFDSGNFMFTSRVFKYAIPHRFQLTKVLRQSKGSALFLNALSEVRLGTCSEETALFIKTLSRKLDSHLEAIATHIFFKKNAVLLFNRSKLEEVEAELVRFEASYEGNAEKISWPGERTLHLKSGCTVMLVWNKSDELKNGSIGTFVKTLDDKIIVNFENVGTVAIERVTWVERNRRGEVIGSVTQFPIILAYAVTCHKSQGLELPAVVLHSSKEFVPGLIYVAMSRVKHHDTMQVLDFNPNQLLPADPEVILQCSRDVGVCDHNLNCCRRRETSEETSFFDVCDRGGGDDCPQDVSEDCFKFPIEVSEGVVHAYFERDDSEIGLCVAQLYEQIESRESEISSPPQEGFEIINILKELKVKPPAPSTGFSKMVNEAVDVLMDPRFSENIKAFVNIMWFHSFLALERHIIENPDDLEVKVSRGDFTLATAKLHAVFTSLEFSQYIKCLFNVTTYTTAQRSVAVEIANAIYMKFLEHLLKVSLNECQREVVVFDVEEMSAAGKAKVRHVGGWAIRKVLEKSRRYVRANLYTENEETMKSVRQHHEICELIEESLVGSIAVLEKESQHKETLQVTEARQFRERGLIHIADAVYRFFMALESLRVQLLNNETLRKERSNMVEVAYHELTSSENLRQKWQECFSKEDVEGKKVHLLF